MNSKKLLDLVPFSGPLGLSGTFVLSQLVFGVHARRVGSVFLDGRELVWYE